MTGPKFSSAPWAYVCVACDHYVSRHRLTGRATEFTAERFYQCLDCGCDITVDSPVHTLDRGQYMAREAAASAPVGGRSQDEQERRPADLEGLRELDEADAHPRE